MGCAYFPLLPAPDGAGVGHIEAPQIRELSGLVKSRTYPGVFWGHNDSGDSARIFALDADGALLGEFAVGGAAHVDWEDIAIDDAGNLYLGDIGDNLNRRTDLRVYRVPEPNPSSSASAVESDLVIPYRYADRERRFDLTDFNYDAEALFHLEGALWIATKHRSDRATRLYRLPMPQTAAEAALSPAATIQLDEGRVLGLDLLGNVTGADLHSGGEWLALLTYRAVFILGVTPGAAPSESPHFEILRRIGLDARRTRQVEAIAWDGDQLVFGNESGDLFRIPDPMAAGVDRYPSRAPESPDR